MTFKYVYADFSKSERRVKPVNSVNLSTLSMFPEVIAELAPPTVRLSGDDAIYIEDIFPNFNLDERFPESYDFSRLDSSLAKVKSTGSDIFLSVSKCRSPYSLYNRLFSDSEKIAKIIEKIIAHYNLGWGCGFKYKIKYVELFPSALDGERFSSREEFFALYKTVATRLKHTYPKLKVGAYSQDGFFALNHFDASEKEKSYVSDLEDFLGFVSAKGEKLPLDFLSWKCYAESPEELSLHTNYANSYLMQFGLRRTESIVSEFNLATEYNPLSAKEYPSELASSLILAEKSSADMMFYSDLTPHSHLNSLYTVDDGESIHRYAAYSVLQSFSELARMKNRVEISEDYRRELYMLAAKDGDEGAILLVTRGYQGMVELSVKGSTYTAYSIKGILGGGKRGVGVVREATDIPLSPKIQLKVGKNEVYRIRLYGKHD